MPLGDVLVHKSKVAQPYMATLLSGLTTSQSYVSTVEDRLHASRAPHVCRRSVHRARSPRTQKCHPDQRPCCTLESACSSEPLPTFVSRKLDEEDTKNLVPIPTLPLGRMGRLCGESAASCYHLGSGQYLPANDKSEDVAGRNGGCPRAGMMKYKKNWMCCS